MRKMQQGFTLIELVVVIVILGILAAFAIPRFSSLDSGARAASINGLAGSMRSASALAHSQYLAGGSTGSSVTMEGTVVPLTNGYPSAGSVTAGITTAIQDVSSYSPTYTAGPPAITSFTTTSPATSASTCYASYTATTSSSTAPVIAVATGGC